jgi:hypothetical protein
VRAVRGCALASRKGGRSALAGAGDDVMYVRYLFTLHFCRVYLREIAGASGATHVCHFACLLDGIPLTSCFGLIFQGKVWRNCVCVCLCAFIYVYIYIYIYIYIHVRIYPVISASLCFLYLINVRIGIPQNNRAGGALTLKIVSRRILAATSQAWTRRRA